MSLVTLMFSLLFESEVTSVLDSFICVSLSEQSFWHFDEDEQQLEEPQLDDDSQQLDEEEQQLDVEEQQLDEEEQHLDEPQHEDEQSAARPAHSFPATAIKRNTKTIRFNS